MKTVKTFSNLAEAGFASSLLEAAGVPALLADEQSFMASYGMATGGVRLQVEDADFDKAVRVLEAGPHAAAPPDETPVSPSTERGLRASDMSNIPFGLFLLGAAVLGLLAFAIYHVREDRRSSTQRSVDQTHEFDYNHDGRADHFFTYRGDRIRTCDADRNFDGKIDEWDFYDDEGRVERSEIDENFDGRPDGWWSFKDGSPTTSRRDTDFNGRPDWVTNYTNGVIVRSDSAPNESEIVTRREIYESGVLREEWVDENGDGTFDYKILYDPFGSPSERIPIEKRR